MKLEPMNVSDDELIATLEQAIADGEIRVVAVASVDPLQGGNYINYTTHNLKFETYTILREFLGEIKGHVHRINVSKAVTTWMMNKLMEDL